jgi:hypothetical protein
MIITTTNINTLTTKATAAVTESRACTVGHNNINTLMTTLLLLEMQLLQVVRGMAVPDQPSQTMDNSQIRRDLMLMEVVFQIHLAVLLLDLGNRSMVLTVVVKIPQSQQDRAHLFKAIDLALRRKQWRVSNKVAYLILKVVSRHSQDILSMEDLGTRMHNILAMVGMDLTTHLLDTAQVTVVEAGRVSIAVNIRRVDASRYLICKQHSCLI